MKSIERVKRAIKFKDIDRLPVVFDLLCESDISVLFIGPPGNWKPKKYPPLTWEIEKRVGNITKEDEWGSVWRVGDTKGGMGEVIEWPLKNLDDLKDFQFPDPTDPGRFKGFQEVIDKNKDKYISAVWVGCLRERLDWIHGFAETLVDLYSDLDKIQPLIDKVLEFNLSLIRNIGERFQGKIHAFDTTEDWGFQTNMFIGPDVWRKVFKPCYKRMADEIHKCGMDFWFHSDGKINEILPDLIEAGVDVLNFPQPRLLGIEKVGKKFAGKVAFLLYIDIQTTAVSGTREEIINEANELVKYWTSENGSGAIAMDYADIDSIGSTMESKKIALTAFKEAYQAKIDGKL